MDSDRAVKPSLTPLFGLSLLSAVVLAYEVAWVRIFSIALWYHFTFLVVSIALLGFGISGTILHLGGDRLRLGFERLAPLVALLAALLVPISYLVTGIIPFDPYRLAWDRVQLAFIGLYYLVLGLPFLSAGILVGMFFNRYPNRSGTVYFANMVGSGIGAAAIVGLLDVTSLERTIAILFGAALIASALLGRSWAKFVAASSVVALLVIVTNPFPEAFPSPYKGLSLALQYPDAKILVTRSNAWSRLDVVKSPIVRFAPGLSLKFEGRLPDQLGIAIDADRLHAITKFGVDLSFLDFLPSALAYKLRPGARTLVIDPVGGLEVVEAIYHGAEKVDAVQANRGIVEILDRDFGDFSGSILSRPNVLTVIEERRGFIRRSKTSYDIIVLPLEDIGSATSTGLYGLSQDYLLTRESFEDMLGHLGPNGIISITRYLLPPPRQELKLVSIARDSLLAKGVKSPENHILAFQSPTTFTLLIGPSAFSQDDIKEFKEFCSRLNFDLVHYPKMKREEANIFNVFEEPYYYDGVTALLGEQGSGFISQYPFDIAAPTDDKPFFQNFFRLAKIGETYKLLRGKWEAFLEGGYLALIILIQAIVISFLVIILPLIIHFKLTKKVVQRRSLLLAYFFFIGVGFMFVEIALIQKFLLVFGNPTHSMALVLFTMLATAGLGSYVSSRISKTGFFPPLIAVLAALGFAMTYIFQFTLSCAPSARLALAIAITAIPAFLMGIPFPFGIRALGNTDVKLIPWAWGINGVASVIASVAAILLAMQIGYRATIVIAAVFYLLAWVSLFVSCRSSEQSSHRLGVGR